MNICMKLQNIKTKFVQNNKHKADKQHKVISNQTLPHAVVLIRYKQVIKVFHIEVNIKIRLLKV